MRWRGHKGAAEFRRAMPAFTHTCRPALLHHHLLAIADAKDRHDPDQTDLGRARRASTRHAVGPARKDHRLGRHSAQERSQRHILIGMDFAIDVQLAQAARNQLRHLAAKVDDEKAVMWMLLCHGLQ